MEETSDCLQSLSPETRDTMAIGKRIEERALEAETGQQTTRRFFFFSPEFTSANDIATLLNAKK